MADEIAPKGKVYVCMACGKWSRTLFGDKDAVAHGWDVSCVLNCTLVDENKLVKNRYGKVVKIV